MSESFTHVAPKHATAGIEIRASCDNCYALSTAFLTNKTASAESFKRCAQPSILLFQAK